MMNSTNPTAPGVSLIAGGAGFIGSTLARRLLATGATVAVVDNLSNGSRRYLSDLEANPAFDLYPADLSVRRECQSVFAEIGSRGRISEVWHLAANSDIPAGVSDSDVDMRDTFTTTAEILRVMRSMDVSVLHFASSSAIYGDLGSEALHESVGPLLPISNYGAMKLASEALISAAAESHLVRANLFRFPNVVGSPATHGVILDFVRKLKANPDLLSVLGNGTQRKAYLHVTDLIDAMLHIRNTPQSGAYPINIGPVDDGVFVRWIAERVVDRVSPKARIEFGVGNKGWVGDVPVFRYRTDRLTESGWRPNLDSSSAVMRAIEEIAIQEGF